MSNRTAIILICPLTADRNMLKSIDDCESTNHSTFTEAISKAADETLVDKERPRPDWFNLSKTILLGAIATRDKAMQEFRNAINEPVQREACSKLRWARKHLKGAVKDAKERWMRKTCEEIEKGSPFRSWDAVKRIKSGFCGHQSVPQNSKILKPDGSLTKSN